MIKSLTLMVLLALPFPAYAQPMRANGRVLEAEVPARAIIELDGSATLETAWVEIPEGEPVSAVIPKEVGIFERQADGTARSGILYHNAKPQPVRRMIRTVPTLVSLAGDRWKVSMDLMGISRNHGTYPPGFERILRQGVYVEVPDPPALAAGDDSRVFQIIYVADEAQFQGAFGNDPQLLADMNAALDRVKSRLEAALADSAAVAQFDVEFVPINGAIATSDPTERFPTWILDVRPKLIEKAALESNYEQTLYDNTPINNSVPFNHSGQVAQASAIVVTLPLHEHLIGIGGPNDGLIQIDTGTMWDFDSENGPPVPPTEDFESVVMHETLHLLGLTSLADETQVPPFISIWDVFRFNEGLGDRVTPQRSSREARELRPDEEAVFAWRLLGNPGSAKASRGERPNGDGFQADHWRSFTRLNPMDPIGIMDPLASALVIEAKGRYYSREDLRAIDTVGWRLEPNDVDLPDPKDVQKGDPPPMAYLTTTTPTFTWTDSTHDRWHVTVFEGSTPDPANEVLAPRDLLVKTYSVPPSTPLQDATTYSWLIAAEVIAGMAYSDVGRFVVCRADCDQTSSVPGTLDVFDFLCFQDKFATSDPYACDFDTSTGAGVCDTFDLLAFQDAFTVGCP